MGKTELEKNKIEIHEGFVRMLHAAEHYQKRYTKDFVLPQSKAVKPLEQLSALIDALQKKSNALLQMQIPELDNEEQPSDEFINARIAIKKYRYFLNDYKKLLDEFVKPLEQMIEHQLTAVDADRHLAMAELVDLKVEPFYLQDKKLADLLKNMETQKQTFSRFLTKIDNTQMNHEERKAFFYSIQRFQSAYKNLGEQAQERYEYLTSDVSLEQDLIEQKQLLLAQAQEVMAQAENQMNNHPELAGTQQELYKKSTDDLKNIAQKKNNKAALHTQLGSSITEYQQDLSVLKGIIRNVHHLLDEMGLNDEKALIVLDEKITKQKDDFYHFYEILISRMDQNGLNTVSVDALQKQFKSIYLETTKLETNSGVLDAHQRKSAQLAELITQMHSLMEQQALQSAEKLREAISTINTELNQALTEVQRDIRHGGMTFTNPEHTARAQALLETKAYQKVSHSSETLDANYRDIMGKKETLDRSIQEMNLILELHKKMQNIMQANKMQALVDALNPLNNDDAVTLLGMVAANYKNQEEFLGVLNQYLPQFNESNLMVIRQLIQEKNGITVDILNNKLDFMAENKQLDYPRLFKKPAVQFLMEKGFKLQDLNLEQIASNDFLHSALLALQAAQIPLSIDAVKSLSSDAAKCAVLASQDQKNELFPQIIKNFLTADADSAQAIYALQRVNPSFCKPWLLLAVQQSEPLKEILLTKDENALKSSVRILQSVLEPLFAQQNRRLAMYYDERLQHNAPAWLSSFNAGLQTEELLSLLNALKHASKQPEKCHLHKAAEAIGYINNFIQDYPKKHPGCSDEVRASLKEFRNAALPMLLSEQSAGDKKQSVIQLAKDQFKPHPLYILADILQCITLAFLIIMPIRAALGKHGLFSQQKTNRQDVVEKTLDTVYQPSKETEVDKDIAEEVETPGNTKKT